MNKFSDTTVHLLLNACREFVRKVEAGEAKSKRSYTEMKAAIKNAERDLSKPDPEPAETPTMLYPFLGRDTPGIMRNGNLFVDAILAETRIKILLAKQRGICSKVGKHHTFGYYRYKPQDMLNAKSPLE